MRVGSYLYKQEQVRILALGGGAVALLDVVGGEVDTLINGPSEVRNVSQTPAATTSSPFLSYQKMCLELFPVADEA